MLLRVAAAGSEAVEVASGGCNTKHGIESQAGWDNKKSTAKLQVSICSCCCAWADATCCVDLDENHPCCDAPDLAINLQAISNIKPALLATRARKGGNATRDREVCMPAPVLLPSFSPSPSLDTWGQNWHHRPALAVLVFGLRCHALRAVPLPDPPPPGGGRGHAAAVPGVHHAPTASAAMHAPALPRGRGYQSSCIEKRLSPAPAAVHAAGRFRLGAQSMCRCDLPVSLQLIARSVCASDLPVRAYTVVFML